MTAKGAALARIERPEDGVTLSQIRDELEAMIAIEEGLEDFRQGRVHSFEQVIEMSGTLISPECSNG